MRPLAIALVLFCTAASSQINVNTGFGNTSVGGSLHLPKKKQKEKEETAPAAAQETPPQPGTVAATGNASAPAPAAATMQPLKVYNNFDFVPGDKIMFEDNFASDMTGEFPARWKLLNGQGVINEVGGQKTFLLTEGNYVRVEPRVNSTSYLGSEFTIEADYLQSQGDAGLIIFLMNGDEDGADISINSTEAGASFPGGQLGANFPKDLANESYYDKWHHLSLAYKNKQLKVYCDQFRVLVVPDCGFVPTRVEFGGIASLENPLKFTNVKVAAGGNMNMLAKLATDGRYVTRGILFDSGKSTIKPQSMGTLNEISAALKKESSLKLQINGHTDSDGNPAANMKLSQDRAEAVKSQLVTMGIDAARLTCKGYGQTMPVEKGDSPEAKAANRRVEFVKIQ